MSYGAWLKQQRTKHDLSQEDLAELVGVDSTYINKIENHRVKRPYPPLRSRIHAVFGTSDSDPDLLPLLSRQDQQAAVMSARRRQPSIGQRIDQLLAIATPAQCRAIELILAGIESLVMEPVTEVTIPDSRSGDNP